MNNSNRLNGVPEMLPHALGEYDALDLALQDSFPASDALSATVVVRVGRPSPQTEVLDELLAVGVRDV